jgi:hypothetical protein
MLVSGFLPQLSMLEPRSGHVGFVVDKVALGQVYSEHLHFPCQFSFHRLLHAYHHLSAGAGTIAQLVADETSGLSLATTRNEKKKLNVQYLPQSYVFKLLSFKLGLINFKESG